MFIMKKAEMKKLFLKICGRDLSDKNYRKLNNEFDKRLYNFLKKAFYVVPIDALTHIVSREIPYLNQTNIYKFIRELYYKNNIQQRGREKKEFVPKEGNEDLYIMYYKALIDEKLDKKEFDKELQNFTKELQKLKNKRTKKRKGKKRTGAVING